jgi:hypothetical protein
MITKAELDKMVEYAANEHYFTVTPNRESDFIRGANYVTGILMPEIERLNGTVVDNQAIIDAITEQGIKNNEYDIFQKGLHDKQIQSLKDENEKFREALESILSNVALDWYVQQFAKDETPRLGTSGIAAKIHNIETLQRIKISFERARQTLDGVSK